MLFRRFSLALVAIAALATATTASAQSTGRVAGRVIDAAQGQPLPGVTVTVVGTPTVVVTDLDGRYVLPLAPGKHQLKLTMSGFDEKTVDVEVQPSITKDVDVALAIAGFSEEITVVGQSVDAETSSLAAQLLERRRSNAITDNLGAQEMKANADSNAASALARVTGLSIVADQYVFVRGLGERYSNTTLNGATIPSTAPDRKVVSLDMFPAGLLDNVSVVKSYTPDRSAEFAGGMVDIVPSRLPARPLANFSYHLGANTQTQGESVLEQSIGDGDWLGLSNDVRQLPAAFPNKRVVRGGIFTPELGVPADELERLGESLINEWTPQVVDGKGDQGFNVAVGNRWGKFGGSFGVSQSYKHRYAEEEQIYYRTEAGGTLSEFSNYDYDVAAAVGFFSTLTNLAYAMTPSHRVGFQAFTTNKGTRETRTFEGFNSDVARNLRNSRMLYEEERLRSFQFSGDHYFQNLSNSRIDWRGSFATTSRDEPDMREVLYEEINGVFQLADESQSGLHMFNDLDEDTWEVDVNWSFAFSGPNGQPMQLKVGPNVSQRERDFSSRRFRFVPLNSVPLVVVRFDLTRPPEELYSTENIGDRFELREETRTTDFYTAEQNIGAGYGMLDWSLSNRSRLIAGVRVENYTQRVDTLDLFATDLGEDPEVIRAEIKETDIFPSINFVRDLGHNQNLRLGFSQTVNRPEFRELAPFEFTDIVGGRAVVGNPELERSLIRNYDVRWEWFPGASEVVAASLFFKDFDKPIERFVEPTAQLRTSFTNAESARNIGFELEARRDLTSHVTASANYTFVDSSITIPESQTNVLTTLERPLAGTSPNILNAMLEVRGGALSGRLLVNYFDERIVDVGSLGLPDIYEAGRTTVDFVLSARLGNRFNVRFQVENLGDEAVLFTQGGLTQREFHIGRTYQIAFGFIGF